jgi:hypothetical protein
MKTSVGLIAGIISLIWIPAFGQTLARPDAAQAPSAPATTAAQDPTRIRARNSATRNVGKKHFRQQPDKAEQQQATAAPSGRGRNRPDHDATQSQQPPPISYSQAIERQHRERHSRAWWKTRYVTIVFVTGRGSYYLDAGYWFPAWGYDPTYENFDYNGPIYTYGDLLPDQVIYNVQHALKDMGYYAGPLSGSMSANTRSAIIGFQEDNGLDITGAIDASTIEALGLY